MTRPRIQIINNDKQSISRAKLIPLPMGNGRKVGKSSRKLPFPHSCDVANFSSSCFDIFTFELVVKKQLSVLYSLRAYETSSKAHVQMKVELRFVRSIVIRTSSTIDPGLINAFLHFRLGNGPNHVDYCISKF